MTLGTMPFPVNVLRPNPEAARPEPTQSGQPLVGRSGKVFHSAAACSTDNNLRILAALMKEQRPARTLEIGLAFGASALTLAAGHRDLGRRPDRQHVAIDPFQSTVWDDLGRMALEAADLDGYVTVYEGFSSQVLPRLVDDEWHCDLAYIDGSHLFEDAFVDFYYISQLLNPRGLVLFDDSADPHVAKVLRFIDRNFHGSFVREDLSRFRRTWGERLRYKAARWLKRTQLTAYRKIGPTRREWNARFVPF